MAVRSIVFIGAALTAIGSSIWLLPGVLSPAADPAAGSRTVHLAAHPDRGMPRQARIEPSPAEPSAVPATSADRFKLVGVVSPRPASRPAPAAAAAEGIALIAVDGKPAKAFRVGATVEGDVVVKEVSEFGAILGPRGDGVAMSLQVSSPPVPPVAMVPAWSTPQVPVEPPAQPQDLLQNHDSKYPQLQPPSESASEIAAAAPPKPADGSWTR
jgi:general secretion pathway protein C